MERRNYCPWPPSPGASLCRQYLLQPLSYTDGYRRAFPLLPMPKPLEVLLQLRQIDSAVFLVTQQAAHGTALFSPELPYPAVSLPELGTACIR